LEDCLSNYKEWKHSKEVADLFWNGRHYSFGTIITAQGLKFLGPMLRDNFNLVFIFQASNPENMKDIYETYGAIVPRKIFYQLMSQIGKKYHGLVIDTTDKTTSRWQEKVFWFEVPEDIGSEDFVIGSSAFRQSQDQIVKQLTDELVAAKLKEMNIEDEKRRMEADRKQFIQRLSKINR